MDVVILKTEKGIMISWYHVSHDASLNSIPRRPVGWLGHFLGQARPWGKVAWFLSYKNPTCRTWAGTGYLSHMSHMTQMAHKLMTFRNTSNSRLQDNPQADRIFKDPSACQFERMVLLKHAFLGICSKPSKGWNILGSNLYSSFLHGKHYGIWVDTACAFW